MRPTQRDFRKKRNYYLALASEAAAPALGVVARLRCGPATPNEAWRKGLIISHAHIGDVLYRTASLPYLRAALPNCEWHYLTTPESAPVLNGNEDVARVNPFVGGEDSWSLTPGGFRLLRDERYDVVLCSNIVRHYPDLTLAVALGIPNRVGYAHRGFSALLTHPISITMPLPYPAYFREMVAQLCEIDASWPLIPRIAIQTSDRVAADAFLAGFAEDGSVLIACCPFTRQVRGSWPERYFVDAINRLAEKTPIAVALCGSGADRDALHAIARNIRGPSKVLAGDLNLTGFAALLSRCRVMLSQDSGPRHIGNAAGVPVVFLRNLWFAPEEAGAYCSTETDAAPVVPLLEESAYVAVQRSVSPETIAEMLQVILDR